MEIVAMYYDERTMTMHAIRTDGVRLRLKKKPPTHVRRPVGDMLDWQFDPIRAVNQWLGFS